jgi:hypothetical protein
MNFDIKLALKYALFLCLFIVVGRVSYKILWHIHGNFEEADFKKTEIKGVIKNYLYYGKKQKNRRAVIVERLDKTEQVVQYRIGCGFVRLIYYSNVGDSVFKERDTFRLQLKNPIRDTIVNDDL